MPGFKYNMTDLQAAIGLHQLARARPQPRAPGRDLPRYDDGLRRPADRAVRAGARRHACTRGISTPCSSTSAGGPSRDDVAERLADAGVATSVHFQALHLHSYYRDRFGFTRGMFPDAERIADTVLSLPLSPALTDAQVEQVIEAFRGVFGA